MPLIRVTSHKVQPPSKEKRVAVNSYPDFGYSHYVTIVLSIASFRFLYLSEFINLSKEYNLSMEHEEALYDWLVNEAMNRTLVVSSGAKVSQHYKHDVYRCVYDRIGHIAESLLVQQFKINNLQFLAGQKVKTLIAGDNLILVTGVITHA